MRTFFVLFLLAFTAHAFSQNVSTKNRGQITELLTQQEKCWNKGNIDGYMAYYWNSDSLKFVTKNGITRGWSKTLENYKQHYPDKASMGTLVFEEIVLEKMNRKTIFVIGKWTLNRISDSIGGRFSLICKKISGTWKIVIDHTS